MITETGLAIAGSLQAILSDLRHGLNWGIGNVSIKRERIAAIGGLCNVLTSDVGTITEQDIQAFKAGHQAAVQAGMGDLLDEEICKWYAKHIDCQEAKPLEFGSDSIQASIRAIVLS